MGTSSPTTNNTFTFRKKHYSRFLQRRLYYVFISNHFQEHITNIEIELAITTDHSPVIMTVLEKNINTKGPGFWKFNKSLLEINIL